MSKKAAGKDAIRDAIETAQPAERSPPPGGSGAPDYLTRRFELRPDGLFKKGEDDRTMWVCAPFAIEAETRDEEGRNWGVVISWHDRDGVKHEEAFQRALFAGECTDIRARFADCGLRSTPHRPPVRRSPNSST